MSVSSTAPALLVAVSLPASAVSIPMLILKSKGIITSESLLCGSESLLDRHIGESTASLL